MIKKSTMRRIHLISFIIMLAVFGLYIMNKWMQYNRYDRSYPEISFAEEVLEVSVKATEEDLLQGVTATDAKDGDITDTLIIESMSNLLENNERIVTYVAFDHDNHVGKAERRIRYTDYKKIRFSLDEPLGRFSGDATLEQILAPLHATDSIDGDISDQIILVDSYWTITNDGYDVATYTVQVTNSCGQVEDLTLSFREMSDGQKYGSNAEITLTDYLIYAKVGDEISPRRYVDTITLNGYEYDMDYVSIESDVDTSKPGTYTITYTFTYNGKSTMSDLIVVVEE